MTSEGPFSRAIESSCKEVSSAAEVDDSSSSSKLGDLGENHLLGRLKEAQTHQAPLYGRNDEKQQIQEAYNRVKNRSLNNDSSVVSSSELVLVCGPSGIGKTGLSYSIRHQVEDIDQGYVICSKFHQMQRSEPQAAFVDAVTDFVARAVDRGDALYYRTAIAMGCKDDAAETENGYQYLCDTFPALKNLLDCASDHQTTSNTKETQSSTESASVDLDISDDAESHDKVAVMLNDKHLLNMENVQHSTKPDCRFRDVLRSLMRAIATSQKPLVWILDDLQWADEYSLGAVQTLLEDKSLNGILFIGTVRGESTEGANLAVNRLLEADASCCRLLLSTLKERDVESLLAESLWIDRDCVMSLASFIQNQTDGIVYFVWELLRELHRQGQLQFNFATGRFACKVETTQDNASSRHGLIRTKVESLDSDDQNHLKVAACMGATLHRTVLTAYMSPSGRSFDAFAKATSSIGLLQYDELQSCWSFSHDVVKDAICDLIPEPERRSFRYRTGRKLWKVLDVNELSRYIFLVVDQLTFSMDCLVEEKERTAVAKLCLCAGMQAFKRSSFVASLNYLERGMALVGSGSWRDEYDLCLDLYSASAEVANILCRCGRVYEIVDVVVTYSRCFTDTIRAQATKVHALGSSGNYAEALKLGFDLLGRLGEPFPAKPSPLGIALEYMRLRRRLKSKSNEAILRMPHMVASDKLAAMQLLNLLFFYALTGGHDKVPLVGFRLVRLTLDHGLCAVSCIGFVLFAASLCGPGRDFKEGRRIGELSFALYEKFGSKSWLARLSVLYYDFVHGWFYPLDSCRDPLEYARQTALDTGDFEFALGCEMVSFYNRLEFDTIDTLMSQLDQLKRRIDLYGHSAAVVLTVAPRQLMENLTSMDSRDPHILEGSFTDATYAGMIASNFLFNAWGELQSTLLCILFGRYKEAAAHSKNCRVLASNSFGPNCGGFSFLLCGLADVACARNLRSRRAAYAKRCSKLLRYSADHGGGLYFLSKHYFLEAELAALAGKNTHAFTLYLSAVSSSEKARLRIQTALANERMAKFLWEQGDVPRARPFFKESLVWYKEWGAIVKVRHLEQEMCDYGIDLSEPASMATSHAMDYPCVYKGL